VSRRWLVAGLLSIALAIAYIDRTDIAFALTSKDLIALFRLSDAERGVLNSGFFWTYGILQIPAGYLVDKYGAKWPLAAGFFLWCLAGASSALATTFWMLFGFRMLLGLAESIVTPAAMAWLREHFEEENRGAAVGVLFAGSKYGPALAAPFAAWLIARYDWRIMFLVLGLGGLIWLIPWMIVCPKDTPREVRRAKAPDVPFAPLLKTRVMWGTLIGTFCYNYFVFFALTWLPAYFVEQRHLSITSTGIYSMFSYGGMAIVAVLAGFAADWWIARGADPVNTRRWFTIVGLLVASSEVIGALAESPGVAVFFAILSMSGLGLATANYWSLTQTLAPPAVAGRIAGAQNMALTAAGIVAPIATGWLKQVTGSYAAPMVMMGVILAIGVGSYLVLVTPEGRLVPAEVPA
jgi:MFS transporter, ACS family, D-galactonate transporter